MTSPAATPSQAIERGASHIVVGRPITGADDPVAAFDAIVARAGRKRRVKDSPKSPLLGLISTKIAPVPSKLSHPLCGIAGQGLNFGRSILHFLRVSSNLWRPRLSILYVLRAKMPIIESDITQLFGGTRMALPQLTDEQRKQALEKAAAARHARAELREQIKKGEKSLESVLNSMTPSLPA